jgi:predicted Zn finger-like uncharacterized protein
MVLVVECESCHSRFRVKKSLLGGTFAIRFRCRTCGGFIVARNPDMPKIGEVPSPVPSPTPVSPEVPGAPATDREPDRPEGAVPFEPAKSDPPVPEVPRIDDLVPFSPVEDASRDRVRTANAAPEKRVATGTRSTAIRKREWAIGVFSFFAGLGILLLLASGAYYLGAFNPWGLSPAKKPAVPHSPNAASATAKPVFEVQNLDAYIPREALAGNLFVITGTVKNVGNASSRGIRIQATLFGKDNQVLIEQTALAGNSIDKFALPHLMRAAIEGHMAAARTEAGTGYHDIPPGNSLPFTVVCFDPPGVVESYEVLATNAEL